MVASWLPFRVFWRRFRRLSGMKINSHPLLPIFMRIRSQKGDFGGGSHFAVSRDWLPPVSAGQSVYSPYRKHLLPITGYHPEPRNRGISSDVAARADTIWTRDHESEKWELLSGSVFRHETLFHTLPQNTLKQQVRSGESEKSAHHSALKESTPFGIIRTGIRTTPAPPLTTLGAR